MDDRSVLVSGHFLVLHDMLYISKSIIRIIRLNYIKKSNFPDIANQLFSRQSRISKISDPDWPLS